jgi:hypothetical protein
MRTRSDEGSILMSTLDDVIDRGKSIAGAAVQRVGRLTRQARGAVEGARHAAAPAKPKPGMDDVTLQRKVETIVFRPEGAPKGSVDVNVAEGVVYLRGEVKRPEDVNALESAVRAIPEVRGVENLLHLPKTPAPTRADTPRRQQKTRETAPRSARPDAGKPPARVTAERTPAAAEPAPDELASEGKGRQPAPLGSEDPDSTD